MVKGVRGETRANVIVPLSKPVGPSPVGAPEFFYDVEQRTPEWFELRRGVPTSSQFGAILANGVGRDRLLYRLAGEILTGEVGETFRSEAMQRGVEMEAEARDYYARSRLADLKECGFARRKLPSGRFVGASPDSFVGQDGGLEIKTMRPDLMIELIQKRSVPTEHRAQIHGTMWVTGRKWIDLMIFYRGMPTSLVYRYERDDVYIKEISNAVEVFDFDLHKLVENVRRMAK